MKQKFKHAFMKTAYVFAELSSAVKLKVGAVVVKDDRIISLGYNGTPTGWDNTCELEIINFQDGSVQLKTKSEVIHAEMNALMKLASSSESGKGAAIFITHSPCMECAKGIYQTGITEVYYTEAYRNVDGIEFLQKCGITIEKIAAD
jgi:dCMP deaminase